MKEDNPVKETNSCKGICFFWEAGEKNRRVMKSIVKENMSDVTPQGGITLIRVMEKVTPGEICWHSLITEIKRIWFQEESGHHQSLTSLTITRTAKRGRNLLTEMSLANSECRSCWISLPSSKLDERNTHNHNLRISFNFYLLQWSPVFNHDHDDCVSATTGFKESIIKNKICMISFYNLQLNRKNYEKVSVFILVSESFRSF